MNEVINFNYEGNEIPFKVDENGEVFMNATEMARHFDGKNVNNFLRGKELLAYINALHESKFIPQIRGIKESPLILTEAKKLGTWFQENLALRFSQWLNPKFGIWCDERIKEIITQGFSALTQDATDYINDQVGIEVNMNDLIKSGVTSRARR